MTIKVDGTNGVLQACDYQVLTTGFSYTFASGTQLLLAVPAETLATGTVTMPSSPVDGMNITITSTQQITALTVNANTGQSIVGGTTFVSAGGSQTFVYRLANTTWYSQNNSSTFITPGSQLFTSSGTFTVPPGITTIKVYVRGGGGGGAAGGTDTCGGNLAGGAGGYGGQSNGFLTVTPGSTFTVTVGAGGAGSNSGAGSAGGTSSFAANFTATGGGGGLVPVGNAVGVSGASGTGTGATFNTMLPVMSSSARPRAASSTAAVAYVVGNTTNYAGGAGLGESGTSGANAVGGVGGAVLVEW